MCLTTMDFFDKFYGNKLPQENYKAQDSLKNCY